MSFDFLKTKPAVLLTVVLLSQAAMLMALTRRETDVNTLPLKDVPAMIGGWSKLQDGVIDQETLDVLKSDDILNREYVRTATGEHAMLFVAMFKSQRNGKTPHSPKNCLPGSGWLQEDTRTIYIDVPGQATPVEANRYVVAKGDARAIVTYWYQSRGRSVADEYKAKYFVMEDAIRHNRTDTSIIKVTTMVGYGGAQAAEDAAKDLVRASYQTLLTYLPH